ncbi:MAG: hypothetical protein IJW63_05325 [Lachnospiraceae bacterium]|nr:hypothetical protein [Lachnospiraceae bacterium]
MRIDKSLRQDKYCDRRAKRAKAQRLNQLVGRIYGCLIALLVFVVLYFMTEFNFINYYIEMKEYEEQGTLVKAEMIEAGDYERTTRGKYSRFKPPGKKDLTLSYVLDGQNYIQTYENVFLDGEEANTEKYTHIEVYVLPDGADVQSRWVVEKCMERAKWEFGMYPLTLLVIFGAGVGAFWILADRKPNKSLER